MSLVNHSSIIYISLNGLFVFILDLGVKGHCWNGGRVGREAVALISGMSSYIGAATYNNIQGGYMVKKKIAAIQHCYDAYCYSFLQLSKNSLR